MPERADGGTPRPALVTALATLVFAIACLAAAPRRVGDADEYLMLAIELGHGRSPTLDAARIARLRDELARIGAGFEGHPIAEHFVPDGRGGLQAAHFWIYPAIVAPVLRVTEAVGASPLRAFAIVNLLLLAAASWAIGSRLEPLSALFVLLGPIIWWTDKVHAEAFMFSMLAIAFALLDRAPGVAFVALGVAAAQNPPVTPVLAVVAVDRLARGRLGPAASGARIGLAAGVAIALVHPLVSLATLGRVTPQLATGAAAARWPSLGRLLVPLFDPALGLAACAPIPFALAALAAARLVAERRIVDGPLPLVAGTAAILLVSFAQTTNLNSGATPGLSRYATWLLPLAVPLLGARGAPPLPRVAWTASVAASIAASLVLFWPTRRDQGLTTTWAAAWIWQHAPALSNPPAEIFYERVNGYDSPTIAPAAYGGCAKVLVVRGAAPRECPLPAIPEACRTAAYCYANRGGAGYEYRVTER